MSAQGAAALQTQVTTIVTSNANKEITATLMRGLLGDHVDSFYNKLDIPLADQTVAETGTSNVHFMTPLGTKQAIQLSLNGLLDGAPAALDTLNELAAAIADDADYAASITTALAGKAPLAHSHSISDVTGLQTALDGKEAANANLLKNNVSAVLDVGFTAASPTALVITTGTHVPDPTLGNIQDVTFNGAFTFDPPSTIGSYAMRYDITIGASAGAVTFDDAILLDGDDLTIVSGDKFRVWIDHSALGTTIFIKAMQ